jgi:hypothetical protein
MPDFPSAEALFASLHGRIYSATRGAATEDRMITGHGGWEPPSSIIIWLRLGGKSPRLATWSSAGVEVETMVVPYPQPPDLFEHANLFDVIRNAIISPPDPTFPLTLTVERSEPTIPVDGRDRIFTTYTCGNALVATARVGELHLRLTCQVAEFQRGFAIRSLSQAELERLVEERRSNHVPSWWWEDKESGPDEANA